MSAGTIILQVLHKASNIEILKTGLFDPSISSPKRIDFKFYVWKFVDNKSCKAQTYCSVSLKD